MNDRIVVLTDGKAGHENQSKAFARSLGGEVALVGVKFKSKLHKALSYLLDRLGIRTLSLVTLERSVEGARAVVGTGSGTFYAVKALARRLGAKGGVVLYPRGYDLASFDCILAPSFDRPVSAPNVVTIPANLVASDEAFYAKGTEAFLARHRPVKPRAVAVIVGGPNRCSTMSVEWTRRQLDRIFAENGDCEFWVTTSRRTPPEVESEVASRPWDYALIYSRDRFNPIPAFVRLADRIYVTAESTGMLSEACTFGKAEVFALDNLNPGPSKFRRFIDGLRDGGYLNGSRKVDLSAEFAAARRLMGVS